MSEALGNISADWDEFCAELGAGDFKLLKCSEMEGLFEPSARLTARLRELYPTMREQLDTAVVRTYQGTGKLREADAVGLYVCRGLRIH